MLIGEHSRKCVIRNGLDPDVVKWEGKLDPDKLEDDPDASPSKHKKPSLLEFVETLEKEARHQADLLDLLRRGTIVCPTYKEATIPSIPPEYHAFKKRKNRCCRR